MNDLEAIAAKFEKLGHVGTARLIRHHHQRAVRYVMLGLDIAEQGPLEPEELLELNDFVFDQRSYTR